MSKWTSTAVALSAAAALGGSHAVGSAAEARLAGPYIGVWSAQLTVAQAIRKGDERMAGRFRLVLRRNGTYTASNPFDRATHGRLAALSGRRLRFSRDSGCLAGGYEVSGGGVYRWTLRGGRLTLRRISEGPCTGRTQTLTYPVWRRR